MLVGVVGASDVRWPMKFRGLLQLVRVAPARVVSVAHASVASADSG